MSRCEGWNRCRRLCTACRHQKVRAILLRFAILGGGAKAPWAAKPLSLQATATGPSKAIPALTLRGLRQAAARPVLSCLPRPEVISSCSLRQSFAFPLFDLRRRSFPPLVQVRQQHHDVATYRLGQAEDERCHGRPDGGVEGRRCLGQRSLSRRRSLQWSRPRTSLH